MTRALRAATLVALTLVGAFAPAVGAPAASPPTAPDGGSVGIRLLDAPADRRDDPRAQVYIVDHLPPGSTIERRVEVANDTPETADIQLYAAGGDIEDGSFTFFEARDGNEVSDWTTVAPATITVPAGDTEAATVRIDVPADASEGERYAVVWAELPAATGGDVTVVNRVGVRVYLSVGPGGEPPTDFSIDSLTASRTAEDAPQVVAAVSNTGGRAVDLGGELSLRDGPGGVSAGPFPAQLGTTLGVDESGEVLVELDPALADGPWQAELILRSGRTERSLSAAIEFPPAGEAEAVSPDPGGVPWAWIIGALLLLLAALAWLLLFLRRRREDPQPHGPPAAGQGAPGSRMPAGSRSNQSRTARS